ncbi:MAG: hypothetical protein JNK18_13045 [Cyclobacteriaceae bacterium]|nr:hypothetical protein [Cyclobacteriaceae bacterium]
MRVIKGIVLFCFSVVLVSGCFDPPEFSDTPQITFRDIKFKEVGGAADYDSLILYLDFKDGNGDVGLSAVDPTDFDPPYNAEFFYVEDINSSGDTIPVLSKVVTIADTIYTIINPDSVGGKLVTTDTRNKPNYGYLPAFDPGGCGDYAAVSGVLVPMKTVDSSFEIQAIKTINGRKYAKIRGSLLYKQNPNHYNIEIKFFRFQGGNFVEFDWFKEYCITFNGRFPTSLNDFPTYKDRPIDGSIRYAMPNTSFLAVFGSTRLRISARIRDRALHVSNEVVTPEFDLNAIR